MISAYIELLRPRQWIKNVFVLAGLLFAHGWRNTTMLHHVLLAFVAFSLASSATYVVNDYVDRDADRQHPRKSRRPFAAGRVRIGAALAVAAACAVGAMVLAYAVSVALAMIIAGYLLLNGAYSTTLKHVPIVDVFAIALGFVLRLLAGTVGVGIEPSSWLILCGLLITLFLGFAKRRVEFMLLQESAASHRKVLDDYSAPLLDHLISICAGAAIVTYALYTVSPHVIALHGGTNLVYSVPFAIYGVFRYLWRVLRNDCSGDAGDDLLADRHMAAAAIGWCASVIWALG